MLLLPFLSEYSVLTFSSPGDCLGFMATMEAM